MLGYRGITPVQSFESDIHPLRRVQQQWTGDKESVKHALFAGKDMMICINDDGKSYQLTYLDMAHPAKFQTEQEAMDVATDFARAVLLSMLAHIGYQKEDGLNNEFI